MSGLYIGNTPIGKVNVGVFSDNGYDTSTATASDILYPKTAFGRDGKITGNIQSMSGGTYTTNQTIATSGKYLTGDIVVDVPASGITPSGTKTINSNGTHDVASYASAQVDVQPNLQNKIVEYTSNGTYRVKYDQEYDGIGMADVTVNVPINGIDTSDATATGDDIASDRSAYVNGQKVFGNIPVVLSGYNYTVEPTYSGSSTSKYIFYQTNASDSIIRSGAKFSVEIPKTDFGDAEASDVLKGKVFTSSAGFKKSGTMTVQNYYTGSAIPDSSLGSDGDLYFRS